MKGFLLMIIAIVLSAVLMPVGYLYTMITFRFSVKKLGAYWKIIAVSIDQLGNAVCANLFNDLLIKKEGHKFGDEDETISMVLGLNKASKTLLPLGKALAGLLRSIYFDTL